MSNGACDNSNCSCQHIAVTWAPNRKLFDTKVNPRKQFQQHFRKVLNSLRLCSKNYHIYPEFHLSGDLHYHMTICLCDQIKWYKKILPTFKYHGYVVVKTLFNYPEWKKYCIKALKLTEKVLNQPLPITWETDITITLNEHNKLLDSYFYPEDHGPKDSNTLSEVRTRSRSATSESE